MSAARTFLVTFSLLALVLVTAMIGCEPDRSGTSVGNMPPRIFVVNTPPDNAQFSRNPELNWYATDIDGYIAFFRHSVVLDSMLVINGSPVTPEEYIAQASDDMFNWDTLIVDLDHPQSSATIRLFADTLDPVNTFIPQYFFVQAQDDRGAKSDIIFRRYSRNNHYPNTHHRTGTVFINAIDADSPAPGIRVRWDGADSTDWGRAEPPLEYEWRLYGPFDTVADIYVNILQEDCVYDPTGDSFVNCVDVPVLNLDAIPDELPVNIGSVANPEYIYRQQPLAHSRGPNYASDPTDVWVTDMETTIYNVFDGMGLTKTSKYKFVFWVRTRDDGFVPDPSPAFSQFNVVEALFERKVAVIDETGYTTTDGRWQPVDIDTVKSIFKTLINRAGVDDFDTTNQLGTDFFNSSGFKNRYNDTLTVRKAGLLDILSHQVLIYYTDAADAGPNETPLGQMFNVFYGLDMGANSVIFSRNIANVKSTNDERFERVVMSGNFRNYFGINSVNVEAWSWGVYNITNIRNPIFNEEFVGAYANLAGYPNIDLNWGLDTLATRDTIINGTPTVVVTDSVQSLLDQRYGRWVLKRSHVMEGLPEVGVCEKTLMAAPVYLYLSRNGDASVFNGKVCAIRQQDGDMRSAAFLFTPIAMDSIPMQECFNVTYNWLAEKFQTGGTALKPSTSYGTAFSDITERQDRIQRYLDYISEYATPEERQDLGIEIKPFVVQPVESIQ